MTSNSKLAQTTNDVGIRWVAVIIFYSAILFLISSIFINEKYLSKIGIILILLAILITSYVWVKAVDPDKWYGNSLDEACSIVNKKLFAYPIHLCDLSGLNFLRNNKNPPNVNINEVHYQRATDKSWKMIVQYYISKNWMVLVFSAIPILMFLFYGLYDFKINRLYRNLPFLHPIFMIYSVTLFGTLFWFSCSVILFKFFIKKRK
jgi:hypothetical protein